jgi:hypothetical protein
MIRFVIANVSPLMDLSAVGRTTTDYRRWRLSDVGGRRADRRR